MTGLWRGTWQTRARIASGLVLFVYAFLHFVNIALGLASPEAMDAFQTARQALIRSWPGTVALYGALALHFGLALASLLQRGTLRMPLREALQLGLGLTIPVFLIAHVIFTRGAHEAFGVNDEYGYLIGLIWGSEAAWTQSLLLLVVWLHGCIGLHVWLRGQDWWQRAQAWLVAGAVLVPALALAGFVAEARRIAPLLRDPETAEPLMIAYNWFDAEAFETMIRWTDQGKTAFWFLVGLAAAGYGLRWLMRRRQSVRIAYIDGPIIQAPKGLTLLEMSRANGIPHTSLCGGKGRCTTCRVMIEDGADKLHPPSEAEARSLAAVGAPPNTRLACQIRPRDPLTVFRVFQPDGRRARAHASHGEERRLAILFLDMRGFTARTAGQLPYDVVFLLNRFFDAIVPPITLAGGTVDKYLGDGLMAVFDAPQPEASARAALEAARGIGTALDAFNATLAREGGTAVQIGIGLHMGDIVLGEIGAGRAPRTIIGDAVNTASRLEAKTKDLGVPLLASEDLLLGAGLSTAALDLVSLDLRGVAAPVRALPVAELPQLGSLVDAHAAQPGRSA